MSRYQTSLRKREALKIAEDHGIVADSQEVRLALIEHMDKGELTLDDVQTELKRIKRNAKKNGKMTRDQIWRKA